MSRFDNYDRADLENFYAKVREHYDDYKSKNYNLDMSRGKPAPQQLDLSNPMLFDLDDYMSEDGIDCRNYGVLDGLPEVKRIFADLLDVTPEEVIVAGSSSLSMMFENISSNMLHGVHDGQPWATQGKIKFLCPSPGYDRHFAICKYFHIEMIPIKMTPTGPDMDTIEKLAIQDPMIKGIWCVPKYSNPDGIVYDDQTVRRLANLRTAAYDFRLYWDNAYAIHDLYGEEHNILNILRECEEAGNPNMPLIFTSFSKVTFAGGSMSALCASKANIEFIKTRLEVQTIGPNKLNQLRHARFLKNADEVKEHMKKHADILRPKFDIVLNTLERELGNLDICTWTKPRGGYFISFYATDGCAKKIVSYCKEAGVILTDAGATYPNNHDPNDSNIRLAPSFPSPEELQTCIDIFCTVVKLVTLEKLLLD